MFSIWLFTAYFLLPVVFGYISHVFNSPRKAVIYRQRFRRIRLWTKVEYSAAAFFFATSVFFIIGILTKVGVKFSGRFSFSVIGVDCLAAIIFLYHYWGGSGFFIRHKELIKFLIAPLAIGVATLSKIYSDAGISELSGLVPQDFPNAQLFLTLILTPVIWLVVSSLALGYISLLIMPMLLVKGIFQDILKNKIKMVNAKNNMLSDIVALVAICIGIMLLLNIMQKIVSKSFYETRLRQAIEFSSFHLPTTYCGLPLVLGASIAPMSNDRAALAIPDAKLGYKFLVISCKTISSSNEEVSEILRKN